jgi:hypothetical protein
MFATLQASYIIFSTYYFFFQHSSVVGLNSARLCTAHWKIEAWRPRPLPYQGRFLMGQYHNVFGFFYTFLKSLFYMDQDIHISQKKTSADLPF